MTLGTRLFTWLKGRKVGEDYLGNAYYVEKAVSGDRRSRRWVIYKGEAEASTVPSEWHGWLHHTSDALPGPDGGRPKRPWQKEHVPNLTGTDDAYRPPGHVLKGGVRAPATGDYEPWTPS